MVTVAVNVTGVPRSEGDGAAVTAVLVVSGATVWDRGGMPGTSSGGSGFSFSAMRSHRLTAR